MENIEEIKLNLKQTMSEKRFLHSLGTMKMAEKLAIKHGYDEQIAALVGLVHDIGKEIPKQEMFKYIEENKIKIDEIEEKNTALLHAKIGASIAKNKYNFTEEMQNAIKYHTTANPNMDKLAKIIYVADKIEETRNYEQIEELRNVAMQNLNKAVLLILNHDIKKNIDNGKIIHPDSILTRNQILSEE